MKKETITIEELQRAIENTIMMGKRTFTFNHTDMIMHDLVGALRLKKTRFWDDYEKIRGLLEDYTGEPLCDSTKLNKIVKKLIKECKH